MKQAGRALADANCTVGKRETGFARSGAVAIGIHQGLGVFTTCERIMKTS
jgi:hypothetical protein